MTRRLVFLIGASGAGKSAVARLLENRAPWTGNTHFLDSIGVPSPEKMEADHGGAGGWQKWATEQWIARLAREQTAVQLLEGQTRPSFILPAVAASPGLEPLIILLDCSPEVRRQRLATGRGQPELASPRTACWAAYLRGQADALQLPVVDTDDLTLEEVAAEVEAIALDGNSTPLDVPSGKIEYRPIGTVHSPFSRLEDMPIQPGSATAAEGWIEVLARYQGGLGDLDGFSHAILLYHFHEVSRVEVTVKPFLDEESRGVFATRAPTRPNPIGLSVVPIQRIEGRRVYVANLDILDGTPLLDIKPYVPPFDRPEDVRIGWLSGRVDQLAARRSDGRFK